MHNLHREDFDEVMHALNSDEELQSFGLDYETKATIVRFALNRLAKGQRGRDLFRGVRHDCDAAGMSVMVIFLAIKIIVLIAELYFKTR